MAGSLRENPKQFSDLSVRSLRDARDLISSTATHWIGADASLAVLRGLDAMIRVVNAMKRAPQLPVDESVAEEWANSIIAYMLAFSSVLAALKALSSRQSASTRIENVAALAHWSKSYAITAYSLSKSLGLLRPPTPTGPLPVSDEEDIMLANAGLDSYLEALVNYEQS
jgi:hypothetical protein